MNMKKVILGILIGLSLSTISVVAISLCNAKDIEYKASDTNWDVDTVEDALNDLYNENSCDVNEEFLTYLKKHPFTFPYVGESIEYDVPFSGTYLIELWGADDGSANGSTTSQGQGGYVSGEIKLKNNQILYIYVGGAGGANQNSYTGGKGGWNGGATAPNSYFKNAGSTVGAGGGGATDIRLVGGEWNEFESLKSRIMVAGGGGGAITLSSNKAGSAGGLVGYNGNHVHTGYGGAQTEGGACYSSSNLTTSNCQGSFGYANSIPYYSSRYPNTGAGGGGGYYGGGSGPSAVGANNGGLGGGGSSFISGHDGCNAILAESTESDIKHSSDSKHYSNLVFTNTKMIDGEGYEWTNVKGEVVGLPEPDIETNGNGFAKITYIGQ